MKIQNLPTLLGFVLDQKNRQRTDVQSLVEIVRADFSQSCILCDVWWVKIADLGAWRYALNPKVQKMKVENFFIFFLDFDHIADYFHSFLSIFSLF